MMANNLDIDNLLETLLKIVGLFLPSPKPASDIKTLFDTVSNGKPSEYKDVLDEMKKNKGGYPDNFKPVDNDDQLKDLPPTLEEIGISFDLSAEAQNEADTLLDAVAKLGELLKRPNRGSRPRTPDGKIHGEAPLPPTITKKDSHYAQDMADILLDAEVRLGEILDNRPPKIRSSQGGTSKPLPSDISKRQSHQAQTRRIPARVGEPNSVIREYRVTSSHPRARGRTFYRFPDGTGRNYVSPRAWENLHHFVDVNKVANFATPKTDRSN